MLHVRPGRKGLIVYLCPCLWPLFWWFDRWRNFSLLFSLCMQHFIQLERSKTRCEVTLVSHWLIGVNNDLALCWVWTLLNSIDELTGLPAVFPWTSLTSMLLIKPSSISQCHIVLHHQWVLCVVLIAGTCRTPTGSLLSNWAYWTSPTMDPVASLNE